MLLSVEAEGKLVSRIDLHWLTFPIQNDILTLFTNISCFLLDLHFWHTCIKQDALHGSMSTVKHNLSAHRVRLQFEHAVCDIQGRRTPYHACCLLSATIKSSSTAVSSSRLWCGSACLRCVCLVHWYGYCAIDVPLWRAINQKVLQASIRVCWCLFALK